MAAFGSRCGRDRLAHITAHYPQHEFLVMLGNSRPSGLFALQGTLEFGLFHFGKRGSGGLSAALAHEKHHGRGPCKDQHDRRAPEQQGLAAQAWVEQHELAVARDESSTDWFWQTMQRSWAESARARASSAGSASTSSGLTAKAGSAASTKAVARSRRRIIPPPRARVSPCAPSAARRRAGGGRTARRRRPSS